MSVWKTGSLALESLLSSLTTFRSIIRVIRLELSILKHSLQQPSIEKLSLLNHTVHHVDTSLSRLRLDKTHEGNVRLEINIRAKIKTLLWRTKLLKTKLRLLRGFDAGLVSHDSVLVPHVDTERDINMTLHAPRHIMEAAIKGKLSRTYLSQTRKILDALGDLVPGAVVLIGGGIARCGDRLVAENERV